MKKKSAVVEGEREEAVQMWQRLGMKSTHLEQSRLSTLWKAAGMALIDQGLVADVAHSYTSCIGEK